MKKLLLLCIFLLTACSNNTSFLCKRYKHKNTLEETTLFVSKRGTVEKEIKTKNTETSKRGLYTVQDNLFSVYIQDTKAQYNILDNGNELIEIPNNKLFYCD